MRRREDGERGSSKSTGRSERVESSSGVMVDRRISKKLKGKVVSTCMTRACLYRTETLAMTELQQQRLQVCENNWVRKIARVTRAYVQEKNGGFKARDRSVEELDRETSEDQTTMGMTR